MIAGRPWAWPLVPAYAAGLAVKDGLRAAGLLKTQRLQWPVVSVGSLSAGGAGKTPVVMALVELLRAGGWAVDVLSRGYGRMGAGVERVDTAAANAARRFGDEPVMIARRTGAGVWVGASRFAAGSAAEDVSSWEKNMGILRFAQNDNEESQNDGVKDDGLKADAQPALRRVHVLDDGFQHRQLARALDLAVVTEQDLYDALLPAGNRREPLRALRRADVIVLREEECAAIEERVRRWMRGDATIRIVRRTVRFTGKDGEGKEAAVEITRPLAFCGIARPVDFWTTIARSGYETVGTMSFGDHHAYAIEDMERLVNVARERGAAGFVTTEKDAVKLTAAMRSRLETVGAVCVARLEARFVDEAAVMRDVEARLG